MTRHLDGISRPRYLDVGCSTGFVVEAARDRGWDAIGIDLNPSAIEYGVSRGLDLRAVALESGGFAPASFDAVSLFDVLEHLFDPVRTLRDCAALLKPGGIIFLYVPNYDSASRLLMGKDAHFIWPTHHLNYYTPQTIRDVMRRQGLTAEYVATEGLDIVDDLWYRREVHGADDAGWRRSPTRCILHQRGGVWQELRVIARKAGSGAVKVRSPSCTWLLPQLRTVIRAWPSGASRPSDPDETEGMGGQELAVRLAAQYPSVTWGLLPSLAAEPWYDPRASCRRPRLVRALEPRYVASPKRACGPREDAAPRALDDRGAAPWTGVTRAR